MSDNTLNNKKVEVGIGGYIALIAAIIFFSGLLQKSGTFLRFFDYTNVLGSFGKLGSLSEGAGSLAANFRGTGGSGARDGFLFSLTLTPAVMLALGVVKVVEDYNGLRAAQKLLTPILRPLMGIPGICGLALIATLQSTDTGASMTKELYEAGEINDNERTIFAMFQFTGGACLTNYLSSGAALHGFLEVPMILPLALILLFKYLAAVWARLYINLVTKKK